MTNTTVRTPCLKFAGRNIQSRCLCLSATLAMAVLVYPVITGCDLVVGLPAESSLDQGCSNGFDDDLDGQVDCGDSDCLPACEFISKGVCCFESGECAVVSPSECPANVAVYRGNGTTCLANPCPSREGACCNGTDCFVQSEEDCGGTGGRFLGARTSCSMVSCENPTGACCDAVGNCHDSSEDQCLALPGTYLGDGNFCTGPCF